MWGPRCCEDDMESIGWLEHTGGLGDKMEESIWWRENLKV
jgi:hypothetical protein